jgi:hypothetical protein
MDVNYILLDGAKVGVDLKIAKETGFAFRSLFEGHASKDLQDVAPYLFEYRQSGKIGDWYLDRGFGRDAGVLFYSRERFEGCYRHFKQLRFVKIENGKELFFRFYDPRVLSVFLPTCDKKQIIEFFGPVDYFLVEDSRQDTVVQFWHQNGILQQKTIDAMA